MILEWVGYSSEQDSSGTCCLGVIFGIRWNSFQVAGKPSTHAFRADQQPQMNPTLSEQAFSQNGRQRFVDAWKHQSHDPGFVRECISWLYRRLAPFNQLSERITFKHRLNTYKRSRQSQAVEDVPYPGLETIWYLDTRTSPMWAG